MELIDNIAFRINDPKMLKGNYAPYILQSMNRVYRRINRETKCLEKLLEIAAGTFSDTVDYVVMPSDMIEIFRIEPAMAYRDPNNYVFINEENSQIENTYTITRGRIYFSGVDETSSFYVWYYSSGFAIVDKEDEDLEDNEINAPEWPWADTHQLLYYATCLEISNDYPMAKQDLKNYNELLNRLKQAGYQKQSTTPTIAGGTGIPRKIDDYDVI